MQTSNDETNTDHTLDSSNSLTGAETPVAGAVNDGVENSAHESRADHVDDVEQVDQVDQRKHAAQAELKSFHNIVLVGPMASGKSTVGWLLAKNLGMGFVDLDQEIERAEGKTVREIFDERGEESFRALERQTLERLKHVKGQVLAVGGGALNDDENWAILQDMGIKIWLNPPAEELARRLMSETQDLSTRPLLTDLSSMKDLDQKRKILIERMAALSGQRVHRYSQAELEVSDSFATPESTMRVIKRELQHQGYLDKQEGTFRFDKWQVFS